MLRWASQEVDEIRIVDFEVGWDSTKRCRLRDLSNTEDAGNPIVGSGFVFDITILPQARRLGHGQRAFELLEPLARDLGLISIGLNVFANNPAALALYRRLGYEVTNIAMNKRLGPRG